MQLTYAGQVFLVVVAVLMIWSFVLTKFWVKRLGKNRKSSKFEFAYLFAVVFSISALFFPFTYLGFSGSLRLSNQTNLRCNCSELYF